MFVDLTILLKQLEKNTEYQHKKITLNITLYMQSSMSEVYYTHIRLISRNYTTIFSSATNCGTMVTHNFSFIIAVNYSNHTDIRYPVFDSVEKISLKYSANTSYLMLAVIISSL